ncbi:outer membrane protein [Hyphomicrobium sp.]|uniref:outer membrane protein n=1 Tax=Hyphomicrobium sp. TaxID=82 RepID=UPI002B6505E7|nr:outer membrane beta-barrel protein [Hyphomicrobium sp.]HVZ03154.1 outer membrane beta-barrel protein [Hyphomicrobium sp.]
MRKLIIAMAITIGSILIDSSVLHAQSLKDGPLPIEEKSWSGFYVGAGGGFNSLVSEFEGKPGAAVASEPGATGAHASFDGLGSTGGFGTVVIGADYQFNARWVAGAFGEYDFEDIGSGASLDIPGIPLSARANVDVNGKVSVGARLGYLFSPDTLWYVAGGYSRVSLSDLTLDIIGTQPDISATVEMPSLSGAFIGAGAETRITEHLSLRAEYRYTDFGSGKVGLPTIDGTDLNDFVDVHIAPTMQEGRASLNCRF